MSNIISKKGINMQENLVIIGNGMAGMRTLEELLKIAPNKYNITVFGTEPCVNYNRIMLSPVLAKAQKFEDIIINSQQWYDENNITLHVSEEIVDIDRSTKTITSINGISVPYDKLWIATGSSPFIIPIPGKDLNGVVTFRDMQDVNTMLEAATQYKNAVVIGGGLLGLEAAHGLSLAGMNITVIHLADTLMERQLDEAAGYLLKSELESRGMTILTGANTKEIIGKNRVEQVNLADGTQIKADLVVMAVGIKPNVDLAKKAGIDCQRGIVVNDTMLTSDKDIYAVGECAQHRGICYGLVAPLYEAGKIMAQSIAGQDVAYEGSVTSTKLKVSGINLFSGGDFSGGDGTEDVIFRDAVRGVYKRLVMKNNAVIGAVLYGDVADGAWYFNQIKSGEDISELRESIIFGQALALSDGGALDPLAAVTALPDDAEICGCNGVCKGEIVAAISANGLSTLSAVRATTKASASCGSCTGL
ncbi:MAG: NAD(P)/FAD-dependent oxidoreductase, partial [Rhizobiales bacterium]|nr:NAD(P)/FAD-dependent oxidoreductase [Hyphomicrobiales bacterium]